MQPIQQMQQKLNNTSLRNFETMKKSAQRNYEGVQRTLENSEKYKKLKSMGRDAFDKIQNSGNIQGALKRGQAMAKTTLQNIQNSDFVKGLNAKMQEKMNDIIQKINENIQMMKDDLKVETITDLANILIESKKDEWVAVGNFLIQGADSIREEKNSSTGGGKKYKSKKHKYIKNNRTKKYKSSKNNRTKKHKSSKNNRTKKHKKSKKKTRKKNNLIFSS